MSDKTLVVLKNGHKLIANMPVREFIKTITRDRAVVPEGSTEVWQDLFIVYSEIATIHDLDQAHETKP